MDHSKKAEELFRSGCNCAQSVTVAFCDLTGWTEEEAGRLSCSFGGGFGRLREVCGAFSGMMLVLGRLYGYADPGPEDENKRRHYALVQSLAEQFRQEMGSLICRELLDNPSSDPTPTPRTAEFYQTRPCGRIVATAARIMDQYIQEHPLEHG